MYFMVNLINFVPLITLFSMDIAKNIKKLHEERGLTQKDVANVVGVQPSNYSKMEKGEREFGIEVIDKLAKFFGLTIDELVHSNNKLPKELKVEDKTATEKIQLISQLDVEDKNAVYRIIDGMLTKNKFQTFFE
jgi:transcriptional regulator with XRE-family HTH domain